MSKILINLRATSRLSDSLVALKTTENFPAPKEMLATVEERKLTDRLADMIASNSLAYEVCRHYPVRHCYFKLT